MIQSPGLLVPDTKLDLAVAPLDFLARAAHLWDAPGRLRPAAEPGLRLPLADGTVLRARAPCWTCPAGWCSACGWRWCCASPSSAPRTVARALGVRSDLACLLGRSGVRAVARACSRSSGPSSIEVWPMALAPWVLLPLVVGAERGSPRRAAALSALAVAMVGGVNAAATVAVLPLGALWLLTRTPGPAPTLDDAVVAGLHAAGDAVVAGPALPARQPTARPSSTSSSPPAVTTFPTDHRSTRCAGTSNWVPYVDAPVPGRARPADRSSTWSLNSAASCWPGRRRHRAAPHPHRRFLVIGVADRALPRDHGPPRRRPGLVRPEHQRPARRRARAAAQRPQVRPGGPAAAGGSAWPSPSTRCCVASGARTHRRGGAPTAIANRVLAAMRRAGRSGDDLAAARSGASPPRKGFDGRPRLLE